MPCTVSLSLPRIPPSLLPLTDSLACISIPHKFTILHGYCMCILRIIMIELVTISLTNSILFTWLLSWPVCVHNIMYYIQCTYTYVRIFMTVFISLTNSILTSIATVLAYMYVHVIHVRVVTVIVLVSNIPHKFNIALL